MYIEIENACKSFGAGKRNPVLENVSLDVARGEFVCLLGPSGCGKSTLLNAMAGFERLDSGMIRVGNEPVAGPSSRRVMIFQNYGLLPWRTVRRNVELGLESREHTPAQRREIAQKYLDAVHLSEYADRHPHRLSGGQQQRVAIARALAVQPDILFMDEPFGALDVITRGKLQQELRKIVREEGCTVIFVTHDIDEAIMLADRIVVMEPNPGRIRIVLPVKLSFPRERTDTDFIELRKTILREFFHSEERKIEYYI